MKIFFGFCLLLWGSQAGAQFAGGSGSGDLVAAHGSGATCSFYAGGPFSGYDTTGVRSPAWDCQSLYLGDSASGYGLSERMAGQNCLFFTGNEGGGYSRDSRPSTQHCIFFNGNLGQGYSQRSAMDDNADNCVIVVAIDASPLQGRWHEQKAHLFWQTYAEPEHEGFQLWKSFDGIDWFLLQGFEPLGTAGSGARYDFFDGQTPRNWQYYRYRQQSFDGSVHWSNIVALEWQLPAAGQTQWTLFPNPISPNQTELRLRGWNIGQDETVELRLVNALGQVLRTESHEVQAPESLLRFSIEQIPPGLYYLGLMLDQGRAPLYLPLRIAPD